MRPTCLLTVSRLTTSSAAGRRFDMLAASSPAPPARGGQRLDQAPHRRGGAGLGMGTACYPSNARTAGQGGRADAPRPPLHGSKPRRPLLDPSCARSRTTGHGARTPGGRPEGRQGPWTTPPIIRPGEACFGFDPVGWPWIRDVGRPTRSRTRRRRSQRRQRMRRISASNKQLRDAEVQVPPPAHGTAIDPPSRRTGTGAQRRRRRRGGSSLSRR